MVTIAELTASPWNIELHEPFGIASGSQEIAANVLVELRLSNDIVGCGEAAPFPAVNGETQQASLAAITAVKDALIGRSIEDWRDLATSLRDTLGVNKSALCAIETALLDAYCREQGVSLWAWAGGSERCLVTDITIPTGTVERASEAASNARALGFTQLKIKVGGATFDLDRRRILAVLAAAPEAQVLLDGNAAFDAEEAVELIFSLGNARQRLVAFEQPTPKSDFEALRTVRDKTGLKIAADESAQDSNDVAELARIAAIDMVNIKIMKSGVLEALAMIERAKALGLELMIGGMVESDLAMGASAALAGGVGGFGWLDLDTPLFMKGVPTKGGISRSGALIEIDTASSGHGVTPCITRGV